MLGNVDSLHLHKLTLGSSFLPWLELSFLLPKLKMRFCFLHHGSLDPQMRRSSALKSRARPPSGMPLSCLAWEGPPALPVFLQAEGIWPELWAAVAGTYPSSPSHGARFREGVAFHALSTSLGAWEMHSGEHKETIGMMTFSAKLF